MDLALNNLQRLICHKTKQTKPNNSKLKSLESNPAYDCTFNLKKQNLFEQREKTIKTFGLCMEHILIDTDISLTNIHDTIQLSSPLWLLKQPVVILDLNKLPKNKTYPLPYQKKLNVPNHLWQSQSLTHFHGWLQKQQWNQMWSSSSQENLEKTPPKRGLHIFCQNLCNKFGTCFNKQQGKIHHSDSICSTIS